MDTENPVPAEVARGGPPAGQEPALSKAAEYPLPAEAGQAPVLSKAAEHPLPAEALIWGPPVPAEVLIWGPPAAQKPAPSKWVMWVRRYKFSFFFVVAAGWLAFGAVALLPSHAPTYGPGAFTITGPVSSARIVDISISVLAVSADVKDLRMIIGTGRPRNTKTVTMGLELPQGVSLRSCPRGTCGRILRLGGVAGLGEFTVLHATLHRFTAGGVWVADIDIPVTGQLFAFDANGVTAEAQLPSFSSPPSKLKFVTVSYYMPGAKYYDWGGAPSAPNFANPNVVAWRERLANAGTTIPVTATDHNAETHDNTLIFVAGIFLGTAGAALIAGFQELFQVIKDSQEGPARKADGPAGEIV